MKAKKQLWKILALILTIGLIAAACGSDDDDGGSDTSSEEDGGEETEAADEEAAPEEEAAEEEAPAEGAAGGEAVLIAEQWPECLNPVTSCANASWLAWSVSTHIGARAMELTPEDGYQASPVVVEEPTLDNGGLVENDDGTFLLTYNLNPDAVWSDGTPMSCEDFAFTKDAHLDSVGSLQTAGFDLITDVDCSTEGTVVMTFSEPYAPWRDLFGGATNFLLPAHHFESTDISEDWLEEITISGGPWLLEGWSPEQATFVPNTSYWDADRIPLLERVVIVPREDTDSEIASLQAGGDQGVAAYPQPFPGAADRFESSGIDFIPQPGDFFEGLWLNQLAPESGDLLSNKAVREALLYSLDREEIANAALGSVMESPAVLQCALSNGPQVAGGFWCDPDFEDATQDFEMAAAILEEDGWTKDGDCWEKDGRELEIDWNTVAGNQRREDVQALVQEMTREFGICWTLTNYDAGELFGNRLPALNFNMGLYANGNGPDPSVVQLYDIDGIPTEDNEFTGQNYTACESDLCADASELAFEADRTIDDEARRDLIFEVGDIMREEVVWIPLYMLPNITAWRADQIVGAEGEIGLYGATLYGGFANMYDWALVS